MSNRIKEQYDKLYTTNPSIFGEGSLLFLKKILANHVVKRGRALDIGAGEGKTSAYLVQSGFVVDAVDISDVAFDVGINKDKVTFHHTSIHDFDIKHHYSLVYVALVTHHVLREAMISIVQNLQAHTEVEGVHIYRLFTTNSAFYTQSEGKGFYDDSQMLRELYAEWDIVFDEYKVGQATTVAVQNEYREVVFRKNKS